jgi:uncharacterized protein YoxC
VEEIQPIVEEIQPIVEEIQPIVEEIQPIVEEIQPIVEEIQPILEEIQPIVEETQQPIVEEIQPVVEEIQPIVEEIQPIVEEIQHVVEEIQPIVEEIQPIVEEIQPVVEEIQPVVEEIQPVIEEIQPVIEEIQPVVEEIQPVVEEIQPVVDTIIEPPKLIFIVPYRDREEQRRFFSLHMKNILKGESHRIIFIHQEDKRSFNRGAMKNIGFLYCKLIYPNNYKDITFVFNDVDTTPIDKGRINYHTEHGKVKHFYGYNTTLGGIVSIKGKDMEKTNGFPNFWAWGYEDNTFQFRVERSGLKIDRSQFYPIQDNINILQLKDGITRVVNRGEFDTYVNEAKYSNNRDGIHSLYNVSFQYNEYTNFLDVKSFETPNKENILLNKIHDMRNGAIPFKQNRSRRLPLIDMQWIR